MILGLGAEVASEGSDRGEAEEQEANEDVGAVEAGEAVEDRAEGEVAGAEADVGVLVYLDEEEGRAEQPGEDQAQFEAAAVAPPDRLQRVVDREAGETRIAVLTPATATGSSKGSGGQAGGSTTTRRKKYDAKKAPKSMISETMKSRMPRVWRSIREL
jgi:hypothetical protein